MSDLQASEAISRALAGSLTEPERASFFESLAGEPRLLDLARISAQIQLAARHAERLESLPVEAGQQRLGDFSDDSDRELCLSEFSKARLQRLLQEATRQTPQTTSTDWQYQHVAQEQSLYERSHARSIDSGSGHGERAREPSVTSRELRRAVDSMLVRLLGRLARTLPSLSELLEWFQQELASDVSYGHWWILSERGELLMSYPSEALAKQGSRAWILQRTPAQLEQLCANISQQGENYLDQEQTYATYWKLTSDASVVFVLLKALSA